MEEMLKEMMGDAYKENMTSEEIQAFFKNQVLGTGLYVNKEAADAEKRNLQKELDAKKLELQNKMTDDEKKAAADKALQEELENLRKQVLQGQINSSELKAMSITAKARLNSGIADDDSDFKEFISYISSEDDAKTTKAANYINTIIEKAYEKGKADTTKNKLGGMGNFKNGSNDNDGGKTSAEERAERLAKSNQVTKIENSYFK